MGKMKKRIFILCILLFENRLSEKKTDSKEVI